MKLMAIIADDEPLARQKLRDLLDEVDWIECVGEATDGPSTLRAIDSLEPDLAFLDIRMPKMSAIDVLKRATHKPAVIFTTAYDQYAVTAFELQAVDYLLKPFGRERFQAALERLKASWGDAEKAERAERMTSALSGQESISRIFVRERGRITPLKVSQIERIEANDDYASLCVGSREHLVHVTLNALERRLDPGKFLRIHRSHIVNLDHVVSFVPHGNGQLDALLKSGAKVRVSRARAKELRHLVL